MTAMPRATPASLTLASRRAAAAAHL